MPNYKIEFKRQWIERDTLERVIVADSEEQAQEIADKMAAEFDNCCPDDVSGSKDGEACDWGVEDVEETDEPADEEEDEMVTCECGADVDTSFRSQCDSCGRIVTV